MSTVMAVLARLKFQCGIVVLPLVIIIVVCSVDVACGMFELRHCSHQYPRAYEVSSTRKRRFSFSFSLLHSYCLFTFVACLHSFGRHTLAKLLDFSSPVLFPFSRFFSRTIFTVFSFHVSSIVPNYYFFPVIPIKLYFVSVEKKSAWF